MVYSFLYTIRCGVLFIYLWATPNAYFQINEQLHTFFIILTAHSGLVGKQKMHMKAIEQMGYLAPEIEMNEICVEQGFTLSNPNSEPMPEISGEKEEIGW